MVTTDEAKTETTASDNGTEKKARKRIDPRVKMVKALHSILAEQLRENDLIGATDTAADLLNYLQAVRND